MGEHSLRTLGVIQDFCTAMGMSHVSPAGDGSVSVWLERAGTLCLTPTQGGAHVLVSLKRTFPDLQVEDLTRFLELPRWDFFLSITVNVGMCIDGSLVLLADFEEQDFTLQALEQSVEMLGTLYDAWLSGANSNYLTGND